MTIPSSHVARGFPGRSTARLSTDGRSAPLESPLVSESTTAPAPFRQAVASLAAVRPRRELIVSALDAPPRLAPFTWAMSVEADASRPAGEDLDEPDTSGRLILLHDPDGQDAWEGTFRLVCFVQARLEREQLGDEMLPIIALVMADRGVRAAPRRIRRPRRHRHPDLVRSLRGHCRTSA